MTSLRTGMLLILASTMITACSKEDADSPEPSPPPQTVEVTGVAPVQGPASGGTMVTVQGSGFEAGASVTFGGVQATSVTFVSSSVLTGLTPSGTEGPVDVEVINPGGKSGTLAGGFTYVSPPAIASVSPNSGPAAGGTSVTITGTDFLAGATVTFGGGAGLNVNVASATTITCDTPAGTGTVDVTVTNPDTQSGLLSAAFTYVPPPGVTSVNPASGPIAGGTSVTITGTDFQAGATVTFGGGAGANVNVPSATTITCDTPAGTGTVDVAVTNPDTQSGTLNNGFQFVSSIRSWELTGRSEFNQQALCNTDSATSPGDVRLAMKPGGYFSSGEIVTCVAYWEGGATPTNQRILVGTSSAGAFLTTNGGTSWTPFNIYTHSNFPSNCALSVAFYNHVSSAGNTFMIGTSLGVAITRDGGTNFTVLTRNTTPAIPYLCAVLDVDFCDGASTPDCMLIAASFLGGTTTNLGGCLYTTDGGITYKLFDRSNLDTGSTQYDSNRTMSADFLDSDSTGQTFLIACSDAVSDPYTEGATFKTTDGGATFSRKRPSWGGAQMHQIVRFDSTDATGATYIIGSDDTAEGAVITSDDGGSFTPISLPVLAKVRDAAFFDGTRFMVATTNGVRITTDGSTFNTIGTASTGGYANIADSYVRGAAWHRRMSGALDFLLGCGDNPTNVVNGAFELTTNGGTAFTRFTGNPAGSNNLAQPPASLPSQYVLDISFDPNDATGNRFIVGTPTGASLTHDGGQTWAWFKSPTIPNNTVWAVAVFSTATNVYLLIGTSGGLAYSSNGGTSFINETANLSGVNTRGVAFFDGTHYAAGTMAGIGAINFNNGGTWSHFNASNNAGIPMNDCRQLDLFRGTAAMDHVIFATNGGGVVHGRFTTSTFTTYNQSGAALPADDVTCVAFDQGSSATTDLRAVVGTNSGGAVKATGLQGASPTWTQYTTANGLPHFRVYDCAYFGGNSAGTHYMFTTFRGVTFTTDGWATLKQISTDRTSGSIYLPRGSRVLCEYHDGTANGARRLFGAQGIAWYDEGGVVLEAGNSNYSSGSMTIPMVDGKLLADSTMSTQSIPDRNIQGVCYFNGNTSAGTFAAATDYGLALTTDGGQTFSVLREPSTPSANSLPSSRMTSVALFKGSNQAMLAGTDKGAALSIDGGSTWTVFDTSSTPALPSNDVKWVAFHDGVSTPDTFLICTAGGTLYVKGGSPVMTFTNSHAASPNNRQTCADFDDSDTSGAYTFIVSSCYYTSQGGGAFLTFDDGTSFTRFTQNSPSGFPTAYVCSSAFFNSSAFILGEDVEYSAKYATTYASAASLTTDTGTSFNHFDDTNGVAGTNLLSGYVRSVALCDRTTNLDHWMTIHRGLGACVTSNGDQAPGTAAFTQYTSTSTPALPHDDAMCGAYWNGTGATGSTWAVGTAGGLVQTTNGGANLGLLRIVPTGYASVDVTETLNGETLTYDILDGRGAVISGYQGLMPTSGSIDISGINIATYPVIQVRVNFSTSTPSVTPVLRSIKIRFVY